MPFHLPFLKPAKKNIDSRRQQRRRRSRIIPASCTAGLLILLANAPLPLSSRLRPAVAKSVKATVIGFGDETTPKAVDEKVRKLLSRTRGPSAWDWLAKKVMGVSYRAETIKPLGIYSMMKINSPQVPTIAHETLHLDPSLAGSQDLLFSNAAEIYFQNVRSWMKLKPRPGFVNPQGNRFYALRNLKRTGKRWEAEVERNGRNYRINRTETGFVVNPSSYGRRKTDEYSWKIPDREYLKPPRNPLEYYRQWNDHNSQGNLFLAAQDLADVATHLEELFQRPGAGMTFLRALSKGVSPEDAEWNAISGAKAKDREREKLFLDAVEAAWKEFEAVSE